MSSSQQAASRLDTHTASEQKPVEEEEFVKEQVLSSNSATTTAKKGIAPKYADEE